MHKEYSQKLLVERLKEVNEYPGIAMRGASVTQDEGLSFVLRTTKKGTNLHPILRFDCNGYDLEPPLVEFIDPTTGEKLSDQFWPGGTVQHHIYGKAICLKETRGYHTHESHVQDGFDQYRNKHSLLLLVITLLDRIDQWDFPGGGPYG